MGKVVKFGLIAVGVAALVIPGVGTAISGALVSAGLSTAAAASLTTGLILQGAVGALGVAAKALGLGPKPPKQSPASLDRLHAGLDPRAVRKIVFGHTAAALDVQYQEYTGAKQEYLNSVIVNASHAFHATEEIWFDETLAWSASAGVSSKYAGYLEVTTREVGTPANAFTITGSTSWTAASSRLTGCAYLWLRYKLTGNSKKSESPFSGGITSRITVRTKAAKLYDPRLDSTRGGSGAHRANDQATWAWASDDVGRNPALQLLWYLLGWRIQNTATGEWKLAVGLGLPPARINFSSFIAAANLCDEPVTLAAGGTEPRYRSDGVFGEGDEPGLVQENLLATMNAALRDAGGQLVLDVLHNDLGTPIVDLTEADVIGSFTWLQTPPVDQLFNQVRGQYVDASDASLYQMADFPDVSNPSPDGIERPTPFNLPMVQSSGQAQRLAKQYLQRAQFPGSFTADFLASAWRCEVGSVARLRFPALGFDFKLFRVTAHTIRFDGTCGMTLREENAAIYAWDAEDAPAVSAAPAIAYDPINAPFVQAIGDSDVIIDAVTTSVGGSYFVDNPAIQNGAIDTPKIAPNAVTVLGTSSASDTFIGAGATVTVLTSGWISVGDATDGGAQVLVFGEIDSGSTKDVGGRINLYIDQGLGFPNTANGTAAAGVRTVNGDSYLKAAVLASATVSGVEQIRVMLEIVSITMPGANAQNFTLRSPQYVVLGTKR